MIRKIKPQKKTNSKKNKKIFKTDAFSEDFEKEDLEDVDIGLCTCDSDQGPDFCEVHKRKECTCDEDPDYCPVHNTWI